MLIIGLLIGINAVVTAIGGYYAYKNNRSINESSRAVAQFFSAESETSGSDFSQVVNWIVEQLATKIGTSVNMSIKGAFGGSTKQLNKELEQVAIEQNPQLALLDILPKSTKKNNLAMLGLQMLMSRSGSGTGGGLGRPLPAADPNSNNGSGEYTGRKHRE